MATTPPIPVTSAVDLHGIEGLRRRASHDGEAALAEAAVQFEALFIGMMLDSARNARLGTGLLDGPQTDQYFKLMDQQVALELARSGGLGLGRMLVEQLTPRGGEQGAVGELKPLPPRAEHSPSQVTTEPATLPTAVDVTAEFPSALPPSLAALGAGIEVGMSESSAEAPPVAADAERFVARFFGEAREAAAALGVEPQLLLAQAALETGWGRALGAADAPANNLFGIKAGRAWDGERTAHWTLEQGATGLEARREEFRAYGNTAASFADYVGLIGGAPRYAAARASATDAEGYARAVSAGGYATDPAYADKWLSIYRGERLAGALRSVLGGE